MPRGRPQTNFGLKIFGLIFRSLILHVRDLQVRRSMFLLMFTSESVHVKCQTVQFSKLSWRFAKTSLRRCFTDWPSKYRFPQKIMDSCSPPMHRPCGSKPKHSESAGNYNKNTESVFCRELVWCDLCRSGTCVTRPSIGNGPNTVSESTVSDTELSEFFGPHRVPGLSELLSA